jgi:hypothetical protein
MSAKRGLKSANSFSEVKPPCPTFSTAPAQALTPVSESKKARNRERMKPQCHESHLPKQAAVVD